MLAATDPSGELPGLLDWLASYEAGLGHADKLFEPTRDLAGLCPVPVLFNDGHFEGSALSFESSEALGFRHDRFREMLRYPSARDIVP